MSLPRDARFRAGSTPESRRLDGRRHGSQWGRSSIDALLCRGQERPVGQNGCELALHGGPPLEILFDLAGTSGEMSPNERTPRPGFQVALEGERSGFLVERDRDPKPPRAPLVGVGRFSRVILGEPPVEVGGYSDVMTIGAPDRFENVDVLQDPFDSSRARARLRSSRPSFRLRFATARASARHPPSRPFEFVFPRIAPKRRQARSA